MRGLGGFLFAALALALGSCPSSVSQQGGVTIAPVPARLSLEFAETIFAGGLRPGWRDGGTAMRQVPPNGPARIRFGEGPWILTRPGFAGTFGGVAFRVKSPPGEGEFLQVSIDSGTVKAQFPRIKISPDNRSDVGGGWTQVFVSMEDLNPNNVPFDSVVIDAFRADVSDWVLIDRVGLTKAVAGPPRPYHLATGAPAVVRLACDAAATKISPMIYGFGGATDAATWAASGVAAHRWGGNPTTRYNWETHFINAGSDWFFENRQSGPYTAFFAENEEHHALGALTVPTIGWVAKDATSYSFPVSVFGSQAKTDPWRTDAGNGQRVDGKNIAPGSATRTSVPAPPEWVGRWVAAIVAADTKRGARSVSEYILDNEPMLWNVTHRDVHPEPVGYDELLDRTIRYGAAIRAADSQALIAGPAEWGWTGYLFSAKDNGLFGAKPDRRAHGDLPLVVWYLRNLREHEKSTGVRVLDVLDLHYYPQAPEVYGGGTGGTAPRTQLLRLRSTRSLWDPSYVDESWIHEPIQLLPRMKAWIDDNYPGLGISIGEWNFGGEWDITGALATAEALGRFAQFGVTSAFYWTMPPPKSVSLEGFAAFRNFDGKGARFLDWYVPSTEPEGISAFASRDEAGGHLVIVVLNLSPGSAVHTKLDVSSCGAVSEQRAYEYLRGSPGFAPLGPVARTPSVEGLLPPWSLTVFDVTVSRPDVPPK